jgi:hypothetical protein
MTFKQLISMFLSSVVVRRPNDVGLDNFLLFQSEASHRLDMILELGVVFEKLHFV